MDPDTAKKQKEAAASAYYRAQHAEEAPSPIEIKIKPARTKPLKYALALLVFGVVCIVLAITTSFVEVLFEALGTIAIVASIVYFVIWGLKTIDKSLSD
jgi:hypothetical protein